MSWRHRMLDARAVTPRAGSANCANRSDLEGVALPNGIIGTNGTPPGIPVPVHRAAEADLLALTALTARGGAAPLPCPSDLAERAAVLAEAAGIEPSAAEARAVAEIGFGTLDELAADRRGSIEAELDRLPAPNSRQGVRLLEVTRAFLASPWFPQAVALGWSLDELFGADPVTPLTRLDRFGLATSLALSVIPGGKLESIEADRAMIRYRSGSLLTFRRFAPAFDDAVPWWECRALIREARL